MINEIQRAWNEIFAIINSLAFFHKANGLLNELPGGQDISGFQIHEFLESNGKDVGGNGEVRTTQHDALGLPDVEVQQPVVQRLMFVGDATKVVAAVDVERAHAHTNLAPLRVLQVTIT